MSDEGQRPAPCSPDVPPRTGAIPQPPPPPSGIGKVRVTRPIPSMDPEVRERARRMVEEPEAYFAEAWEDARRVVAEEMEIRIQRAARRLRDERRERRAAFWVRVRSWFRWST